MTNKILNPQARFLMEQREKTAQLRVKKGQIVEGHSEGTVFWTTPARARMLLDMKVVEMVGPLTVGPSEFKAPETSAGKSSGAPSTGHSIGSAPSLLSGEATSSSASAEDPVSDPTRSKSSESSASGALPKDPPLASSESSQSTTPTSSRPSQMSSTSPTPRGGSGTRTSKRSRTSRA